MAKRFTLYVVLAMLLGIVTGTICHAAVTDAAALQALGGYFSIATDAFLRLIKMIIAPLVFSTLCVGIAHMGDFGRLGRVGLRTPGLVPARLARVAAARDPDGDAARSPAPRSACRCRRATPRPAFRRRA